MTTATLRPATAVRNLRTAWTALRDAAARQGHADPAYSLYGSRIALVLDSRRARLGARADLALTHARDGLAGLPAEEARAVTDALEALIGSL